MAKLKNDWEEARRIFSESSGTPEEVIDYVACRQILTLYVHGKGINTISNVLKTDREWVAQAIEEFLGELVHVDDLEYDPYYTNDSEYLEVFAKYDIIIHEVERYE